MEKTNLKIVAIIATILLLTLAVFLHQTNASLIINDKDDKHKKCEKTISTEEASNIAIKALNNTFGPSNYTIKEIDFDGKKYKVEAFNQTHKFEIKIDACTGEVLEIEVEEMKFKPSNILINSTQAINIAINFLKSKFGEKNYTVLKIELEGTRYEIKIFDGSNIFKFKISAINGNILEFETEKVEKKMDKIEDKQKVEVKQFEKISGQGLKIEIEKRNTVLKIEFLTKENLTKTELELMLSLDKLIEFTDKEPLNQFDQNDTVLSFINLHSLNWTTTISNTTIDGTLVEIKIEQTTTINNTTILIIYHITPGTKYLQLLDKNVEVKIWEVKFDLHIFNYNWLKNDSKLALLTKFNSEFELHSKDIMEVKFKSSENVTPFFNFGDEVFVDNNPSQVYATFDKNQIYIIYPHFENSLIHDPKIGYEIAYYSAGNVTGTTVTETTPIQTTESSSETKTSTVTQTTELLSETTTAKVDEGIKDKTTKISSPIESPIMQQTLIAIITVILATLILVSVIFRTKKIKKEI